MSIKPNHTVTDCKAEIESGKQTIVSSDESQLTLESDEIIKKNEINGPRGLEPTRYGDWESKGRCVDF